MALHSFKRDGKIRALIKNFAKPYFKSSISTEPLEAWVVIAHYKFTVGALICLFVGLVGGWFANSPMDCYLKYDRTEIQPYQEELCLSYSYTYNSHRERVYALHYRWVHWSILALIPLYCIPLYLNQYLRNDVLSRHLQFIGDSDESTSGRKECIAQVVDAFVGFGTGDLFCQKLLILFVTLLVDAVAFIFIDVCLQNRFARLVPLDYPFTRWPQFLNDTMSLAFPPFVECQIGREMMVINQMEEKFGCSLNLMKVYDKMFVILWLWMVALSAWTLVAIVRHIVFGLCSSCQKNILKVENCQDEFCMKVLCLGDIIFLECLISLLNSEEKEEIFRNISEKIRLFKTKELEG